MEKLDQVLAQLLRLLLSIVNMLIATIATIEAWLRGEMRALGMPREVQTVILLAVAVLLVLSASRSLAGIIRIIVIIVLALVALHLLMPHLHA